MNDKQVSDGRCEICHNHFKNQHMVKVRSLQSSLLHRMMQDYPEIDQNSVVCLEDINRYRNLLLREIIETARGDLDETEEAALRSLKEGEIVSQNAEDNYSEKLTFGQAMADKMARYGGSWAFIGVFTLILFSWILNNTIILINRAFDPYPFILLNLVLSCLAAIQAPVIMMSQNRQETKDRLRAQNDYLVNLKAELEIRILNQKIDYLTREGVQSLEILELQTGLLEELRNQLVDATEKS